MSESMVNALRKIIKENGEEILAENIDRVYNFLTDLVPKEETQRKCIRLALRSGAMKPLYSISAAPEDSEALFKKSVVMVADENCWRDDVAYDTMFSLFSALYPELAGRMTQPTADGTAEIQNASPELLAGGISGIIDENQILGYEYDDEDYSRTWALEFREDKDGYVISNYSSFGIEKNIELPSIYKKRPVVGIGGSAFANSQLDTVSGLNINRVDDSAFADSSISSFDFPSLKYIGERAFQGCNNIKTLTLKDGIILIGKNAFSGCSNLSSVNIGNGPKTIEQGVFSSCSNLADVLLPETVTELKTRSFYYCTSISTMKLPDSIRSIEEEAFYGAEIKSIILPKNLENIYTGDLDGAQEIYVRGFKTQLYYHEKRFSDFKPFVQNYNGVYKKCIMYGGRVCVSDDGGDRIMNRPFYNTPKIYCIIGSEAYKFAQQYSISCTPLPQEYL